MRVLVLALDTYDGEGGIQRYTRRLMGSLRSLQESRTVSLTALVALWDAPSAERHPAVDLYFPCGRSRRRAVLALERLTRHRSYDVIVYTHVLLTAAAPLLRWRSPGARHVLIAYGVEVWDEPSWLRSLVIRRCIDRIASISRYTAALMQERYRITPERFQVVPCAIDAPVVWSSRERRAARPLRLLTVARLVRTARDKHVDAVIRALPAILARHHDLEHVIVGDGDALRDLQDLAQATGVSEHVRFRRWLPDEERDRLYDDSDLFVLPSTREGFGIVFLEAWAHGLAVIGGADGAAPELLGDGGAGRVVDPDPAAIAIEVNRLLDDPGLRRRMGDEGRRRVAQLYSGAQFTENVAVLLEAVKPGVH